MRTSAGQLMVCINAIMVFICKLMSLADLSGSGHDARLRTNAHAPLLTEKLNETDAEGI
jgi:hypothetical protein